VVALGALRKALKMKDLAVGPSGSDDVETPPPDVTALLHAWTAGDEAARDRLVALVYKELHTLAHRYMAGEQPDATLQTTALVNELYVRLVDVRRIGWTGRTHFFAVCAQLLRRVLVDEARSRKAAKRGAQAVHVPADENLIPSPEPPVDVLALDDALDRLAAFDARKSRVVELRFFGGLDVEETAAALDVSPQTVLRDWRLAKVWLFRELSGGDPRGS
jgi:RNA polymerase sigma-70 factor (ECF subfamily)